MMLLIGMKMSLTKKPMKPMIAKPIDVADAILLNSASAKRARECTEISKDRHVRGSADTSAPPQSPSAGAAALCMHQQIANRGGSSKGR